MRNFLVLLSLFTLGLFLSGCTSRRTLATENQTVAGNDSVTAASPAPHPISISALRTLSYPGSKIEIISELPATSTHRLYVTSYQSEGLKIYGLLTVPKGEAPEGGWPAIIFNHGYIPPEQYRTTERYEAYVGGFARNGFVVFKPDYRGHGDSEGDPTGAYFSPGYTVDVLNAIASVKQLDYVNSDKIGLWGHSMGGHITLRAISVDPSIKAAVIWAGVVSDYPDFLNRRRSNPSPSFQPSPREATVNRPGRSQLFEQFGTPDQNPTFWQQISPWAGLADEDTPIQLHHAKGDTSVPWEFSQSLADQLNTLGKPNELFIYEGSDHNLSGSTFSLAMNRSVEFFKQHLQ